MSGKNLLIALLAIGLTTAIVLASTETIKLGPAEISLDLQSAGSNTVEEGDAIKLQHEYGEEGTYFEYTIYPATVKFDDTSSKVLIEVHQMSESEDLDATIAGKEKISGLEHCIEQAEMMADYVDYKAEPYTIDGHEGILATVDTGNENPFYVAAYSPDEVTGSGSIVCIIGSDLIWETTENIFNSLNTQV